MCESTAYVREKGGERVLMAEVASVRPQGDALILMSVLGDRVEVRASIVEVDLMAHRIVLEERVTSPKPGV